MGSSGLPTNSPWDKGMPSTPGTSTPPGDRGRGQPSTRPEITGPTTFGKGVADRGHQVAPWQGAINLWVDARGIIESENGQTYDISDDITTGSLTRNINAPSTLSITINNDGNKYYNKFIPMDRIALWLRRDENMYQAFTGYVADVPIYNLVSSQEITLQCECIIRRLNQKHWDPNLQENAITLGAGAGAPAPGSLPATQGEAPSADIILAFLLTAPDHLGIKPEMVFIQQPPQEFYDFSTQLNGKTTNCLWGWEDLINCPEPAQFGCGEGASGSTGEPGSTGGCPATVGDLLSQSDWPPELHGRVAQIIMHESTGQADAANPSGARGLMQVMPTTASGVGADYEQLDDPLYNVNTGYKVYQSQGFGAWVGDDGTEGDLNLPITNCTPASAGPIDSMIRSSVVSAAPVSPTGEVATGVMNTTATTGTTTGTTGTTGAVPSGSDSFCGPGSVGNPPVSQDATGAPVGGTDASGGFPTTTAGPTGSGGGSGAIPSIPFRTNTAPNAQHYGVDKGWVLWPYTKNIGQVNGAHAGIDIASHDPNAKIYAVGPGTVVQGPRPGNGCGDSVVIIRYDSGAHALYCHNAEGYVSSGDRVRAGTLIGEMGCEGTCSVRSPQYPHLHIQTTLSNDPNDVFDWTKTVDPAIVLGVDSRGSIASYNQQEKATPWLSPNGPIDTKLFAAAGPDSIEAPSLVSEFGRGNDPMNTKRVMRQILFDAENMLRVPFSWGGGHGTRMGYPEDVTRSGDGVDSSGLFNVLRRGAGLEPAEVGSTTDYFNFLTNMRRFDPGKRYPIGTVLIGVGGDGRRSHMAMVIDHMGHILEANGQLGVVDASGTSFAALQEVQLFTHVGEFPDAGTLTTTDVPGLRQGPISAGSVISAAPCDTSAWDHSASGPTTHVHSPLIQEIINAVNAKWPGQTFANTYPGHPGGEANSVDFWAPSGRGGVIDNALGHEIQDFLIANYGDRINWTIFDNQMLDSTGWGPDVSGWGHVDHVHVTAGSMDCGGATIDGAAGNTSGSGGTTSGSTGSGLTMEQVMAMTEEPCIMRNPMGPWWLHVQMGLQGSIGNSELVRNLVLTSGGDMWGSDFATLKYDFENLGLLWSYVKDAIDLVNTSDEVRLWDELGEIYKEPYFGGIKDLADAGFYTMQSIGTGEIVFWYPYLTDTISEFAFTEPDVSTMVQRGTDSAAGGPAAPGSVGGTASAGPPPITPVVSAAPMSPSGEISFPSTDPSGAFTDEASTTDGVVTDSQGGMPDQQTLTGTSSNIPMTGTRLDAAQAENVSVLTRPIILRDVELLDFHLAVSDTPLVTHYYTLGDYRMDGNPSLDPASLFCVRWSTINTNPVMRWKGANEGSSFDAAAFLQRYGSRPKVDLLPSIKLPASAQLWADLNFIKYWMACYTIQLDTAFLPEAYPGQRIVIESLGVQCMIEQVTHSFRNQWSTMMSCSMPIEVIDNSKIPPLPFWSLLTKNELVEGMGDIGQPDPLIVGTPGSRNEAPLSIPFQEDPDSQIIDRFLQEYTAQLYGNREIDGSEPTEIFAPGGEPLSSNTSAGPDDTSQFSESNNLTQADKDLLARYLEWGTEK